MTDTAQSPMYPLACIVLAAGQGTRMRSELPKVLHPIAGLPMLRHVTNACAALAPERVVVVVAPGMKAVQELVVPHRCAIQQEACGTGDAVKAGRSELKGFVGDVMVLFGDTPLVTSEALLALRQKRAATGAAIVVAGFTPVDPAAYGRLILDNDGRLEAIVETNDATPEQRLIRLCNGGIMLFDGATLGPPLDAIKDDNAKKEFYLTDCIGLARAQGLNCAVAEVSAENNAFAPRCAVHDQGIYHAMTLKRLAQLSIRLLGPQARVLFGMTQRGQFNVFNR